MKIQPYVDSWVSETQADSSYPARVLLWCLSISLSLSLFLLSPMCVSRFLPCCQSNRSGSFVFACNLLPTTSSFSHNPSVMFSIFLGMSMCYLLTLCMNANTSVYSNRESYPLIALVVDKKWFECCTGFEILLFFSSIFM